VLDGRRHIHRRIGRRFQVDRFTAAPAAVGRDHELGLRVIDATGERLGREAAENDGMRSADASAREHGDGQLRDHGHVDGDAIARVDAELADGVAALDTSRWRSANVIVRLSPGSPTQ
jgi:hypothetical protein